MKNNIQKQKNLVKGRIDNISSFITEQELIKSGLEYYFEEDLDMFKSNLIKSYKSGIISIDEIEKAKKDVSKLAMRMVTDKNGHRRKVWVKVGKDEKTGKQTETDFKSGDTVTFKNKEGDYESGKLITVTQNSKKDATGAVQIQLSDGKKIWRSMNVVRSGSVGKNAKKEHKKESDKKADKNFKGKKKESKEKTPLTESKIREIFADSGKMKVKDLMSYLEHRHSGNYDKKIARSNAKEVIAEAKRYM